MGQTALVDRSYGTVEHLAIWAYDVESAEGAWDTGSYRPLCGQEKRHDRRWRLVDWLCSARQPRLDPKPLCSRCRHILEDLIALEVPNVPTPDPRETATS